MEPNEKPTMRIEQYGLRVRVWVDGVEIPNIRSIEYRASPIEPGDLRLQVSPLTGEGSTA